MGGWRFVRYVIAVQNGNPIGDRSFALAIRTRPRT